MTEAATALDVTVNGQAREFTDAAHTNLLDWLRSQGLTGAKEGCAEGECGACSVLVARPDGDGDTTRWTALNACLVPAAAFAGQEIITSEGLGSPRRVAPRTAGDGRARRLPMRLLHTRIRLQYGGRILPPGASRVRSRGCR